MEINDELIVQWEPKIYKFLQTTFVLGMDTEDIAQELRIAIMKAAQNFDEDKGITFHTYLHTVMINTLRTLISRAKKSKDFINAYSIHGVSNMTDDLLDNHIPSTINKSLIDPDANEFISDID